MSPADTRFVLLGKSRMDYYLEELTSEDLLLLAGRLFTNRPLTLSSFLLLYSFLTLGS